MKEKQARVVDLTREVSPSIRVFPGSPQPFFIPWSTFKVHGYDSEAMFMSTHTGTHMDAPSHFAPGAPNIDRIPASRLVSSAMLVRVPRKANELITASDIPGEEIMENDAVVFATGWERRANRGNYMTENPGLARDAALRLARLKAGAVAIDAPSIDAGSDSRFSAHNVLLPAGILVAENLCNLEKIRKKRFTLVLSPLRLAGASGSPIRALALLPLR